jgi:hypothetical protein
MGRSNETAGVQEQAAIPCARRRLHSPMVLSLTPSSSTRDACAGFQARSGEDEDDVGDMERAKNALIGPEHPTSTANSALLRTAVRRAVFDSPIAFAGISA